MLEELVSATAEAEQLAFDTSFGKADPVSLKKFARRVGKIQRPTAESAPEMHSAFEDLQRALARLVDAGEAWLKRTTPELEIQARICRLRQAYYLLH